MNEFVVNEQHGNVPLGFRNGDVYIKDSEEQSSEELEGELAY